MQPRDGLVPKKSADSPDRLEVRPVPHGPDASAVDQGLVDREVEAMAGGLHAGAVERARTPVDRDTATPGTAERVVVDSVLEEQQVDPTTSFCFSAR
jgi:hypothetical protein